MKPQITLMYTYCKYQEFKLHRRLGKSWSGDPQLVVLFIPFYKTSDCVQLQEGTFRISRPLERVEAKFEPRLLRRIKPRHSFGRVRMRRRQRVLLKFKVSPDLRLLLSLSKEICDSLELDLFERYKRCKSVEIPTFPQLIPDFSSTSAEGRAWEQSLWLLKNLNIGTLQSVKIRVDPCFPPVDTRFLEYFG